MGERRPLIRAGGLYRIRILCWPCQPNAHARRTTDCKARTCSVRVHLAEAALDNPPLLILIFFRATITGSSRRGPWTAAIFAGPPT